MAVLNRLGDRPWRELRRGKPITEMWLAMQLRPYGIRTKALWIGPESAKGYERADFDDPFRRYLSAARSTSDVSVCASPCESVQEPSTKSTESTESTDHLS